MAESDPVNMVHSLANAGYRPPGSALPVRKIRLSRWMNVVSVVAVALLILTLVGPMLSFRPERFTGDGNPVRQVIYVLLALTMLVYVKPWARPKELLALPLVLTLALAWCWISITWSADPAISARRVALITVSMWTIFMIVRQSNPQDVLQALRVVLVGVLILNYVTALGIPAVGVHQYDSLEGAGLVGAWRGVLLHKNHVGSVSAVTVLAFLFDAKRIHPAVRYLVLAAAFFCLYKSMSKTSMGILAMSVLCGVIYIRYNPAYRLLLVPAVAVLGIVAYFAAFSYRAEIAGLFADPLGFSGRVHIWTVVLRAVAEHPWFGVGYGGFWNAGPNSPIYHYTRDWVSLIATAHCGYIDLMVQIGIPGAVFVVFVALIWPMTKLLATQRISRGAGALLLSLLVFCAGHNLTETTLFYRDEIMQIFLCFTLALVWRNLDRQRNPQSNPQRASTRARP